MVGNELEYWNSRLVNEAAERVLPQWAKDLRAKGYARSIVLAAFVKWDRDESAKGAYA